MFVGIHALLATRTGIPEFEITMDEGKEFTTACQKVMRHYSVETTQKTLDTVALIGSAASLYGPRVAAYHFRMSAEKAAKEMTPPHVNVAGGASNIHPFPNGAEFVG